MTHFRLAVLNFHSNIAASTTVKALGTFELRLQLKVDPLDLTPHEAYHVSIDPDHYHYWGRRP